jgi:crossover junction endodeoxyribonuclease RusA
VAATVVHFEQPDRQITMNLRLHWAAQHRLVRAWRQAAGWAAIAALGGRADGRALPPAEVIVILPVRGDIRRDPHNWMPTAKAIVDGLVDAGCWPDDTPDWVSVGEPELDRKRTDVAVVINPRPTAA